MEPTVSSETSALILQTPGKFPKEHRLHSKHGESLKTTMVQSSLNLCTEQSPKESDDTRCCTNAI